MRRANPCLPQFWSSAMSGLLLLCVGTPGLAQPTSDATALSRAYAALAAGRTAEAQRVAQEGLAAQPRHHGAATVAVLAASTQGGQAGLDAYQNWLAASHHEDAFILEPVALAILGQLAAESGPLQDDAKALSGSGQADGGSATPTPEDHGRQLAADLATAQGGSRVLRLRELALTGYREAAPQVQRLLSDPTPEIRAAAADTLAQLGATEAIPPLQALRRPGERSPVLGGPGASPAWGCQRRHPRHRAPDQRNPGHPASGCRRDGRRPAGQLGAVCRAAAGL